MRNSGERSVVVVTGSSGLVGTQLVGVLAQSHAVIGLDVVEPDGLFAGEAWYHADFSTDAGAAEALGKVRENYGTRIASVVHLADYQDFSGRPAAAYKDITVDGTRRLLRQLQAMEAHQLIFASSISAGRPSRGDVHAPRGLFDYHRAKIEAEKAISREQLKVPALVLRMASMYDDTGHSHVIGRIMRKIYERRREAFAASTYRAMGVPFLHMDDFADGVLRAIERRSELGHLETIVVAEPEVIGYEDLQNRIGELMHGSSWLSGGLSRTLAKAGAWVREKVAREEDPTLRPWMIDLDDDHYPVEIWRGRSRLNWEPRHRLWESLPRIVDEMKRDPRAWYERHEALFPADGPRRSLAEARSR
jgi:nucleoside-diphosphate-sugar epimerase